MDILFLLIPLSVVLVFVIGAVYWLALRGGQFDDLESPGLDIVLDDDSPHPVAPNPEAAPDDDAPDTRAR
jgi:cbb3-type cytochrome oxidase maturation protein